MRGQLPHSAAVEVTQEAGRKGEDGAGEGPCRRSLRGHLIPISTVGPKMNLLDLRQTQPERGACMLVGDGVRSLLPCHKSPARLAAGNSTHLSAPRFCGSEVWAQPSCPPRDLPSSCRPGHGLIRRLSWGRVRLQRPTGGGGFGSLQGRWAESLSSRLGEELEARSVPCHVRLSTWLLTSLKHVH